MRRAPDHQPRRGLATHRNRRRLEAGGRAFGQVASERRLRVERRAAVVVRKRDAVAPHDERRRRNRPERRLEPGLHQRRVVQPPLHAQAPQQRRRKRRQPPLLAPRERLSRTPPTQPSRAGRRRPVRGAGRGPRRPPVITSCHMLARAILDVQQQQRQRPVPLLGSGRSMSYAGRHTAPRRMNASRCVGPLSATP